MPELLDDEAIDEGLRGTGWLRRGDRLVRTVERADFDGSIAVVNAVARLAAEADHHPDITVSWGTVTLTLWTHTAGGITRRDVDLARRIEREVG